MKKIIITITTSGVLVDASGLALIAINPPEVVSECFFLKTINESKAFCLN